MTPKSVRGRRSRLLGFYTSLIAVACGCVPDDTSVDRGALRVTFDPSIYMQTGFFDTEDQWTVQIELAAFAVELYLPCNYLNNGSSQWVFSARERSEFLFRGILPGPCGRFGGRIGADPFKFEDVALSDGLAKSGAASTIAGLAAAGHHAAIVGNAVKGATTYRFSLLIDPLVTPCVSRESQVLNIVAGNRVERRIKVSPERLFGIDDNSLSRTRFDAFAFADERGNRNGIVEDDELARVRFACDPLKYSACLPAELGSYDPHANDPAYNTPNLSRYVRRQLNFVLRFAGTPDCGASRGSVSGADASTN
jgi:hypothetical protein